MKKMLIKELKEMVKSGKGLLSVSSFIKDFDLSEIASISELTEVSKDFKVTIKKGHGFEYLTGYNFGW